MSLETKTPVTDNSPARRERGEIQENYNSSISQWLSNSWHYLTSWFSSKTETNDPYHYPPKDDRYSKLGWNRRYQYCYTDSEEKLINALSEKYTEIFSKSDINPFQLTADKNPFQLTTEKRFYDWWTCTQPKYPLSQHFTLPNREAKDATVFPIWDFADDKAKQIANWQSKRFKNQKPDLVNDPTMIIFEHLKNLFFSELTETGCKNEALSKIALLQSYVKQIMHLVPKYGPDRLYLIDIQNSLIQAGKEVQTCVANKQLPEFLSDIVIKIRSLENTLGSYLHFLLVDEEVAENFSHEFTEGHIKNDKLSPVSRAFNNVNQNINSDMSTALVPLQAVNPFYELISTETPLGTKVSLQLREAALKNIKFASFATAEDKQNYLEGLAALASFINIRETLVEFKKIQSTVGTMIFANSYIENTHALAENVQALVDKSYSLMESLITRADQILEKNYQENINDLHFENNLQTLDNQFAKYTSTLQELETYCLHVKTSMESYQAEMKRLALSLQSGKARQEIGESMQKLLLQINNINQLLSAQVTKNELLLEKPEVVAQITSSEATNALKQKPSDAIAKQKPAEAEKIQAMSGQPTEQPEPLPRIQNILHAGLEGAIHGTLRGTSNVIAELLNSKDWSESAARYLSQLSYYSLFFSYQFLSYQPDESDDPTPWLTALLHAVYITGQTFVLNNVSQWLSRHFDNAAYYLKDHDHPNLAQGLKGLGALTKFGVFAYDAKHRGLAESAASLVAGTGSQIAVETIGKKLIS